MRLTVRVETPRYGRATLPEFTSWSLTVRTVFAGMAKPNPGHIATIAGPCSTTHNRCVDAYDLT